MKVILDGVFNHCGSFNKWLDKERIYENQEGYEKGLTFLLIVLTAAFSVFIMTETGLIILTMMAGGDMIPCQS